MRSTFFSLGQTLSTYRHGVGVFQESLDDAIQLLAHGRAWLHIFPEGRVRQDKNLTSMSPGTNHSCIMTADMTVRYFKWGVSRIVLETAVINGEQPIIVPLFIEGFDQVMHESRTFPRFLPRVGKHVKCTYGKPIDEAKIQPFIDRWKDLLKHGEKKDIAARDGRTETSLSLVDSQEAQAIRSELTKVIRDAVVQVRREAGYPEEHPYAHLAEFYDSEEGLKYDELSGIPRPEIFRKRQPQRSVWEKEGPN